MKIFLEQNVYEAALDRIRRLFDEFPNVVVGFSGGKDSTVTLHLALKIAREKALLPLKVLFIDQEAEWRSTIDRVEAVMTDPDVQPYWFQMPMVITNNASAYRRYARCWDENEREKWIHPKHPISIKQNRYGTDRFHDLFKAIFRVEFGGLKSCYLAGVRSEESPGRLAGLTSSLTYKNITWGKVLDKTQEHYSFYPLYDWGYTDVWACILKNALPYNKVYDRLYQLGVPVREMRVSNLHHETAIQNLLLVQEIEPETWNRITNRIDGANATKHLERDSFTCPSELPPMFRDWQEYALYLLENLVQEKRYRDLCRRKIESEYRKFDKPLIRTDFWRVIINTILSSDWDFTKWKNWSLADHAVSTYKRYHLGWKRNPSMLNDMRYLEPQEQKEILNYFETKRLQRAASQGI